MTVRSTVAVWALVLSAASGASAQSSSSGTSTGTNSSSDLKPATTTFLGDTGLWFVPTAEVLASGQWSGSGYRRGTNYIQGFSNIGDFAGTVAYGLGDRAELFGSFTFITRIDRDLRPIFTSDQTTGGIVDRYPQMRTTWSGNKVGDLSVGAKVSLLPRGDQPVALAVRGVLKAPTGDDEAGVSTGRTDFLADFIASTELSRIVELSGYAGYEWRGRPDGFDIPSGAFRWGGGAGFPSRSPLRAQLELNGLVPNADTATITGSSLVGVDSSLAPLVSVTEKITRATAAATWQSSRGIFVGAGLSWNMPRRDRDLYNTDASNFGDFVDWQVRIGFHPGSRPRGTAMAGGSDRSDSPSASAAPSAPPVAAPEARPATTAPPAAATPANDAAANRDAAGAPGATRAAPGATPAAPGATPAAPPATAGGQEGSNPARTPGTAQPRTYAFEDVYFDFDRYSLRTEATRVLDDAVTAMRQDPNLRLEIEGHTCNIGTAEYNIALGDRRANAVQSYLVSRGVPADRLRTISYGEERAKYDNAREETRRLNRRAALIVNLR